MLMEALRQKLAALALAIKEEKIKEKKIKEKKIKEKHENKRSMAENDNTKNGNSRRGGGDVRSVADALAAHGLETGNALLLRNLSLVSSSFRDASRLALRQHAHSVISDGSSLKKKARLAFDKNHNPYFEDVVSKASHVLDWLDVLKTYASKCAEEVKKQLVHSNNKKIDQYSVPLAESLAMALVHDSSIQNKLEALVSNLSIADHELAIKRPSTIKTLDSISFILDTMTDAVNVDEDLARACSVDSVVMAARLLQRDNGALLAALHESDSYVACIKKLCDMVREAQTISGMLVKVLHAYDYLPSALAGDDDATEHRSLTPLEAHKLDHLVTKSLVFGQKKNNQIMKHNNNKKTKQLKDTMTSMAFNPLVHNSTVQEMGKWMHVQRMTSVLDGTSIFRTASPVPVMTELLPHELAVLIARSLLFQDQQQNMAIGDFFRKMSEGTRKSSIRLPPSWDRFHVRDRELERVRLLTELPVSELQAAYDHLIQNGKGQRKVLKRLIEKEKQNIRGEIHPYYYYPNVIGAYSALIAFDTTLLMLKKVLLVEKYDEQDDALALWQLVTEFGDLLASIPDRSIWKTRGVVENEFQVHGRRRSTRAL
jgi:hypothetical protein